MHRVQPGSGGPRSRPTASPVLGRRRRGAHRSDRPSFGDAADCAAASSRSAPSRCVLDAVDGHVARRTGTATAFGARFDMEVDAFLIVVLSVVRRAARSAGGCSRSARCATRTSPPAGCCRGCGGRSPPRYWAQGGRRGPGHRAGGRGLRLLPDARGRGRPRRRAAAARWSRSAGTSWWQWRHRREPLAPVRRRRSRPVAAAGLVTVAAVVGAVGRAGAAPIARRARPRRLRCGSRSRGWSLVGLAARAAVAAAAGRPPSASGCSPRSLVVLRALGLGFDARPGPAVRPGRATGPTSARARGARRLDRRRPRPCWLLVGAVRAGGRAGRRAALGRAAGDPGRRATTGARSVRAIVALGVGVGAVRGVSGGPAGQVAAAGAAGLVVDAVDQVRADSRTADVFAGRDRGRPVRRRPGRAAARPGCAARTCCSSSSRATAGSRSQDTSYSRRDRRGPRRRAPASWPRPATSRAARS